MSGKDRILQSAATLFAESGYAAISMQTIADHAGVTKATLYHHFVDKDDLFTAAMICRMSSQRARLQQAITATGPLRKRLEAFAGILVQEHMNDLSQLWADFQRNVSAERRATFRTQLPDPWLFLEQALRDAMDAGLIPRRDPTELSVICFGAMMGPIHASQMRRDAISLDDDLPRRVVDILLNGLGA